MSIEVSSPGTVSRVEQSSLNTESRTRDERFAGIGADLLSASKSAPRLSAAITLGAVGVSAPTEIGVAGHPQMPSKSALRDGARTPASLQHSNSVGSSHPSNAPSNLHRSDSEHARSDPSDNEVRWHAHATFQDGGNGQQRQNAYHQRVDSLKRRGIIPSVNHSGSESEYGGSQVARSPPYPPDDQHTSNLRSAITHALHGTEAIQKVSEHSRGQFLGADEGNVDSSSREMLWINLLQSVWLELLSATLVLFSLISHSASVIHTADGSSDTVVLAINFCALVFHLAEFALRYWLRQRSSFMDIVFCITLLPDACWLFGQVDILARVLPGFALPAIRAAAGSRHFFVLSRSLQHSASRFPPEARKSRRGIRGNLERCVETHSQLAACIFLAVAFTCAAVSARRVEAAELELRGDLRLLAYSMVAVGSGVVVDSGLLQAYVERQEARGYTVEELRVGSLWLLGEAADERRWRMYPAEQWEVAEECELEVGSSGRAAGEAAEAEVAVQQSHQELFLRVGMRERARRDAAVAISVVFVIVGAVALLNLVLSTQLSQYVINPVERMVQTIESLSQEPLKPIPQPTHPLKRENSARTWSLGRNRKQTGSQNEHPLSRQGSRTRQTPSQRGDADGGSMRDMSERGETLSIGKESRNSDASLLPPDILSSPFGMRSSDRTPRPHVVLSSPISAFAVDSGDPARSPKREHASKGASANGAAAAVHAANLDVTTTPSEAERDPDPEPRLTLVGSFKKLLPAPKRRDTPPNGQHGLASPSRAPQECARQGTGNEVSKSDKVSRRGTRKSLDSTFIVENALVSFGSLLQLAFGEAGARIISLNRDGTVNPNAMNDVVHACFGFCDIRQFTDLTEVLQGDIVHVVNKIADHVHSAVTDHMGAPNKNIGDAFLSVWKVKSEAEISAQMLAVASLWSTVRVMRDISLCAELKACECRPEVQARMPGFNFSLGFGLHFGWAVECAIGSQHKIDASYLSPHVNLASRLEAATKQYKVPVLFSEEVAKYLSPAILRLCRLLDRVTVKGSTQPLHVYTWDWRPSARPLPFTSAPGTEGEDGALKVRGGGEWERQWSAEELLLLHPPQTTESFRDLFSRAVTAYLGGPVGAESDWQQAKSMLQECCAVRPGDGPSEQLLAFVTKHADPSGDAPSWWRGWRLLGEK